jgi:ribosome modulation factor
MTDIEITRAWARARRLYTSANFQATYVRGAQAALGGRPIDSCPYKKRRGGGWNAWRVAFLAGYQSIPKRSE